MDLSIKRHISTFVDVERVNMIEESMIKLDGGSTRAKVSLCWIDTF